MFFSKCFSKCFFKMFFSSHSTAKLLPARIFLPHTTLITSKCPWRARAWCNCKIGCAPNRLCICITTNANVNTNTSLQYKHCQRHNGPRPANSLERKIQVKHSIGSNFGQMTLPALVLNLPTRWRHLKIQIEHSFGSNFGH